MTVDQIRTASELESRLRQLGGMPPYGCLYRLRLLSEQRSAVSKARDLLGQMLSADPSTRLFRLGRAFMRNRRHELHGLLLNPELDWEQQQEMRWKLHPQGVSLSINPQRGPWL
jgi:primosomal protein N'